jgi:hypothetical protein
MLFGEVQLMLVNVVCRNLIRVSARTLPWQGLLKSIIGFRDRFPLGVPCRPYIDRLSPIRKLPLRSQCFFLIENYRRILFRFLLWLMQRYLIVLRVL